MDFFSILGIDPNATPDQIKKQYRKMSLETHPDRPNGDAERFKEINEAYEAISSGKHVASPGRGFQGININPEDIFMEMFMNAAGPNIVFESAIPMRPEKPANLIVHLHVSLDQAFTGATLPVEIERSVGRTSETELCYVTVPQGVDHNEFIILPNKGTVGKGGVKGDAQIIVLVDCPSHLTRKGWDLYYHHPVSLKDALCGFTFELEFLQGRRIKIANTEGNIVNPTLKKVIPNMGMVRDNKQGALIITFNIIFPPLLAPEKRAALQEILA